MADIQPEESQQGPVYFWREFEKTYGFLSQWYECPFEHDGKRFTTTEMWMMYQKAKLFDDNESAEQILRAETPKQCQAIGRTVKGFDRHIWNREKFRIVEEGNWWKFSAPLDGRGDVKKGLLLTGSRLLVEASPTDRVWGIGYPADTEDGHESEWGENLLGKAIMSVRTRLGVDET